MRVKSIKDSNSIKMTYEKSDDFSIARLFDLIDTQKHHYAKSLRGTGINNTDSEMNVYEGCQGSVMELTELKGSIANACIFSPVATAVVDFVKFGHPEDRDDFLERAKVYSDARNVTVFKSLEGLKDELINIEWMKMLLAELQEPVTLDIREISESTSAYIYDAIKTLRDNSVDKLMIKIDGVPYESSAVPKGKVR